MVLLLDLDLVIKNCFCSGMTDYAKAWLQLAFSSYFMLIAILLLTSCYSFALQRMTIISACNNLIPRSCSLPVLVYSMQYYKMTYFLATKTHLFGQWIQLLNYLMWNSCHYLLSVYVFYFFSYTFQYRALVD